MGEIPIFLIWSSHHIRSVWYRLGAADEEQRSEERKGRRWWSGRKRVWPPLVAESNPHVSHSFKPLPLFFPIPVPVPLPPGMEVEGGGGGGSGCCSSNIRSERSIVHSSSQSPSPLLHLHSNTRGGGCRPQRLAKTRGSPPWLWSQPRPPPQLYIPFFSHGAFTHPGTDSKALHCLTTKAETHTHGAPLLQASGKNTHSCGDGTAFAFTHRNYTYAQWNATKGKSRKDNAGTEWEGKLW